MKARPPDTGQRYRFVTGVLTRQREFELGQPEFIARDKDFTRPPEKPHNPTDLVFNFDQLEYYYRVPGEFTHRLTGDQYGFESMSFIITQTHPGGGPGFHVHDTEEAHVLLEGTAEYRIGDKTFTVQAPYVARVPAGVPHTFIKSTPGPNCSTLSLCLRRNTLTPEGSDRTR